MGAVEDLTRDVLVQQFETNFFGTHELTRQVLPIMRQQGEGRIIQNSSLLGLVVHPYLGAYNTSKFALEGLTDTLRLELAGSGIFVSLIEPGLITSEVWTNADILFKQHIDVKHSQHQKAYAKFEQRFLTKRVGYPPEMVLRKIIHALESRHPQARYYITFPTYLLVTLKRLLPHMIMDWLLRRSF